MDIGIYEDALIDILGTVCNSQKYFGELSNPEKGEFLQNVLPTIYIDFTGEKEVDSYITELHFSLYLVHISYSKNNNNRSQTHKELYQILGAIREKLTDRSIEGSTHVKRKNLSKIFDSKSEKGYLTVYRVEISFSVHI